MAELKTYHPLKATPAYAAANTLSEGFIWYAARQSFFSVDIEGRKLFITTAHVGLGEKALLNTHKAAMYVFTVQPGLKGLLPGKFKCFTDIKVN
ncbi:MAG: hypothetical protein AVDCRST_MAG96-2947 [uncultured Segetibacter sp.]|uniref:Uncharacterized protein n=1 Tax=uncultured Segetibacter sp. TaxID=481133 RepID=A0A6J4TGA9_9BACT|nr:MAG: hypothetical protein AVDCRST_MAG96-2947 [uncultured Segetibacter sp.]